MREIFIKTTASQNHKRKNLSIVEKIDQNGFIARAEKKFSYYVSEKNWFQDPKEVKSWLELMTKARQKKDRHVSITKRFDHKTGEGQMIYRVIGSFYVVQDLHIFAVSFMHTIKFDMLTARLPHEDE